MKKRRAKSENNPKLEMTPMIDVVFQLLIFFIVTLQQEDILSRLDITRPAPDPNPKKVEKIEDLVTIQVYKYGYVLRGRKISAREIKDLEQRLSKLSSISTEASIVIKCTGDSPHSHLVQLLDVCAKLGLNNLSVFSM